MRSRALVSLFVVLLGTSAFSQLRKIGELELQIQGISATVQPANPTIPKNTPAGVQIVVNTASGPLSSADAARFLGGAIQVTGELSGPGLGGAISLPVAGGPIVDPLILPIPALTQAGDYTLSNLKILANGTPALDVTPSSIPVKVIDQVLITSVETRPLTLDEIKAAGVVLTSNDFIGFQFTIGLALQSNATTISFPVVFDRQGVPVPTPLIPPSPPSRDSVPIPTIVPVMLNVVGADGNQVLPNDLKLPDGSPAQVKIPSVLVIPGNVGFLKQFFSAKLLVANGAPGGTGLIVHDINATINLPPGDDGVLGTSDDPLSLPTLQSGPEPATKPVMGAGPDGQLGTADDVSALNPGDQGETEFVIRGDKEGFHPISFDIKGTLNGLVTGPVSVTGQAQGGVLVRNPFFDMTFAVPAIVRNGEQFKVFITVKNISQSTANLLTVTLDKAQMSGVQLLSDQSQTIPTLVGGGSKILTYVFQSQRTGQVSATYLHFDTTDGTTGELKFTLGVGERNVPLSPDTLVLPASVDSLPESVVDAAMRVLGEGWSIANAPTGTLPPNVIRTSKAVVTQKALALAEAGLRVQLGESLDAALRDLLADFYGGNPLDPGFDQLLRTTDAGQDFERAVGAALAPPIASTGVLGFQKNLSNVFASGANFISFALTSGSVAPPVAFSLTDGSGNVARNLGSAQFSNDVPGFTEAPLGSGDASPVLGLLTAPGSSPYTLLLTGTGSGTVDLAVTMPHSDGNVIRGEISGVSVSQGLQSRIVMDISQPDRLVLEQDTAGDGSFATQVPLNTSVIAPSGPQLLSANVIDGTTLQGASALGIHMAVLFDRAVDGNSAKQTGNYQILSNAVQQASAQLSGRIVIANLQQPEGPYVPTSVSVSGIADSRGVIGPSATKPLQSRLQNPGAVVSGRVLNADGTPVGGAVVTYSAYDPDDHCNSDSVPSGISNIAVDGQGHYQVRYVTQDPCARPFRISTQDPNTGDVRTGSNFVRFGGEQIILDLALFGRGSVAGAVTDLTGAPVPGAKVAVQSVTDPQVGALATADGNGQYSVSGITVGPVTVQAGRGNTLGHSAGTILRAGTTATVNVTLDSGGTSVSGVLQEQINGGPPTPVPNWPVVYSLNDHVPPTPVAVVNTDGSGKFVFTAVPEGAFTVSVQLTARDFGSSTGFAVAGTPFTGANITVNIDDQKLATVQGTVVLPDAAHTPAGGVIVSGPSGGVLTNADGTFTLPGLPVRPNSQAIQAQTTDGLRFGSASVLATQPGQVVGGITITLSGLGTAQFTVLDADGKPVAGQAVALMNGCSAACGCNPVKTQVNPDGSVTVSAPPVLTGTDGVVRFTNMPVGSVTVKAVSSTGDIADGSASITGDGVVGFGTLRFHGSGTVTGSVLDPDGNPSFGANVALTANVFDLETCSLIPGLAQQLSTDTSGSFNFTGVKAGRIGLTASQTFFNRQVGAQGNLASHQTANFVLKLLNTTAGVFSGTVFLPDGVTPAGAGVQVTANGALPDVTVSTDANGNFKFAKIFPEGGYTVTVSDPVTGGTVRDSVFLRAAQDMTHNYRLKGRGTVVVQVVDGSNKPVDNAFVKLNENEFPFNEQENAIQPGNQGQVTFEQVFEGPFAVTVSDNVGRGGRASGALPGPGATVNATVQLTSTGTVQGHFKMPDQNGTPIPFGSVSLFASGRQIGQVTTDGGADPGSFSFTFVPAGPVTLQAQDPVTARTGIAAGTIDHDGQVLVLDVTAQALGTVQGHVTSNGVPQPGANVDIFSGSYHAATTSDAQGLYLVSGVPAGHVVVNASMQNGFLLGTNSGTLAGEGALLELEVALRGSGAITGQVVQADGTPAPGVLVTVTVGGPGGGTEKVSTDPSGNFVFSLVPEGLATLNATVLGSIDVGQAVADVVGGSTVQSTIHLNGVGSISGQTEDSLGNLVAGHVTITGTGAFPYTFAIDTNSDGRFSLPQVLAGNFTATLSVTSGSITTLGTTFSKVTPNANTDIVVQLAPTGSVTGVVLRSDGVTPAAGASVTVSIGNGASVVVQAQTDGSFTASGIPLGAFTLRINDPISTGQALIQGQSITGGGDVVDLKTIILNDTPMSVLSIAPADGSSAVSPAQSIVITFSNPLQSVNGIQFSSNHGGVSLTSSLSPDGKVATFSGGLPASAQITVNVTTDVSDTLGRHPLQPATSTFVTGPPGVTSIVPANNAIQVSSTAQITVNFSESLAASTNLANLIVLSSSSGPVAGTTSLVNPQQAVFTPAAALPNNTSFTVTVNGAADSGGNVQTTAFVSTLSTVDTVPPVVQLGSPANGSFVNTARPGISFSATDALTGVEFSTAAVSLDGQPVATGTLSFTPPANLADGVHTVTATVADRVGNVGAASGSFTVDTQPPSPATVSGVTAGQILTGVVPLSFSATDATSGVAFIDLLVDGNFFVRTSPPFQLSLNTPALVDGNHNLSARATDAAGNVGQPGSAVAVVVNNVHLTVSFTAPAAGSSFNNQFTVTATADKSVQRIDFSFAGQQASATVAPYSATFSVSGLTDGTQTVTATATDFAGNSASATLPIVVDRTPPAAPNVNLINAEPPVAGFSQVHGLVGSVEAFDTLAITNLTHAAQATVSVANDGTFSTNVAASVDDTLSLTATDPAGNHSNAVLITVRQTPSVPPATGNTSLTFAGDLVDRVGTAAGTLTPDGNLDAVFTMSLSIGDGVTRTLSRIDLSNGSTTHSAAAGTVPVGVSTDVAAPFLNHSDGSISLTLTSGATLTLITSDSGFMVPGNTYTVTASFTDGSHFVGSFVFVAPEDHPLVAHSANIVASPSMVISSPTSSGTASLTITNVRDVDGTLLPDGSKIGLSVANGATKNGFGDSIPSAGGTIVDGTPSANNANFKVFTISGGSVTATYSGQPVSPSALTGSIAVVQMVGADSSGNVLGTEVAATQDINLHAANDPAIVGTSPASLYADTGDHRSHVVVQVRDNLLNPVPDGTLIAVSAASGAAFIPACCRIGSAGGTILGGTASPSGAQYSVFTTTGGSFAFDYTDSGVSMGTDQTAAAVITVMAANADNSTNGVLIGSGTITLVGAADAEISADRSSVPLVSPSIPVTIDIHHLHDARGNLAPDGSTVLVSAATGATFIPACCRIGSAGGTIVDGLPSPNNGQFRYFTLASSQAAATYTTDGVSSANPGSTVVANIQLAMGAPNGNIIDDHLLKLLGITLVPPSNAVGNAQPPSLLGDGGIHTSTVTFKPIIDAFGNTLPDGSKVAVSAASGATFIPACCNIGSVGGQILSGTTATNDGRFQVHTVVNGGITVTYSDQNVASTPGQVQTANVQLAEAKADNTVPTTANISTVGISIVGLTSATVTASPSVLFADGGDHRSTVTVSNLKDSLGNPVPDGTNIAVSAVNGATFIPGCCNIGSFGGVIEGGTTVVSNTNFKVFPVTNGQVVFEYSSQGVLVSSGTQTANVQIAEANSADGLVSTANVASGSIKLVAPGSATISVNPANVFSDGGTHTSAITITNLKAADGVTPIPDGSRIGISVVNGATFIPGCCNIGSAGGQILSAGTTAGDGTPSPSNGNFDLFSIAGGQILATYADTGLASTIGQTQTVNVQLAPAASDGSIPTTAQFADASIQLRGISSATGSGPATLSKSGGSATVTFSGIKDSAGNLVPDGTLVIVTAANSVFSIPGCCVVGSTGGTIVDGGVSPFNAALKVFVVQNGTVTVTYSPTSAGVGVANIQITGARPDGSLIVSTPLNGGVWAINITN
ncbi:MAG TPA: carboxypeptidase regulatory-like domain-containing protein [Candidatus Angelobacter sp.]|nr:carboxypeptidase regulatory-like domain-containing protein [Candidatus Angelobacter sp.]